MNADIFQQCPHCLRYLLAGEVVRLSVGESLAAVREQRLRMADCGLADCGATVQENTDRERSCRQRAAIDRVTRRDRHAAKQECKSQRSDVRGQRSEPARMPYKDAEIKDEEPLPAPPLGVNVGQGIEHSLSQHEFKASGQADSQNEKLMEFFSLPHNFNKWFKSTFLEELSGATRMNNRAIDLRPEFIKRGHYIDNCMMTDTNTDRKASYYRVCNIEDALSLTTEQKTKLTAAV
ncbi:MAG: hypothetical protein WCS94_14160 [Verrucomicrobiota bacterium]